MKVLFIIPDAESTRPRDSIMLGVAYLSSVLKKHNHSTYLLNFSCVVYNQDKLIKKILLIKPDLIAISILTTHLESECDRISKIIKSNFDVPIVVGGCAVTVNPERFIRMDFVDIVSIGEGEDAVLSLVEALSQNEDYRYIKNLWVKSNNKVFKNDVRHLQQNLDKLPFPDRTIFPEATGTARKPIKELVVMAGRGCPFNCSYCINNSLMKTYKNKGKFVRYRSAKNLVEEIKILKKKHSPRSIWFYDDTFSLDPVWIKEFSKLYADINLTFSINARVETIDNEIISPLKEVGLYEVRIAIESASESVRNNILNRKMSVQKIIEAFEIIKKNNIKFKLYSLIGIPSEKKEDIFKTILFNIRVCPTTFQYFVLQPYPSTEIYSLCKKNNYLVGDVSSVKYCSFDSTIQTNQFNPTEIKILYFIAFVITGISLKTKFLFSRTSDRTILLFLSMIFHICNNRINYLLIICLLHSKRILIEFMRKLQKKYFTFRLGDYNVS